MFLSYLNYCIMYLNFLPLHYVLYGDMKFHLTGFINNSVIPCNPPNISVLNFS